MSDDYLVGNARFAKRALEIADEMETIITELSITDFGDEEDLQVRYINLLNTICLATNNAAELQRNFHELCLLLERVGGLRLRGDFRNSAVRPPRIQQELGALYSEVMLDILDGHENEENFKSFVSSLKRLLLVAKEMQRLLYIGVSPQTHQSLHKMLEE